VFLGYDAAYGSINYRRFGGPRGVSIPSRRSLIIAASFPRMIINAPVRT